MGGRCPRGALGLCIGLWDEEHVPGLDEDDAAIYGEAILRRRHWPVWMLMVCPHWQCNRIMREPNMTTAEPKDPMARQTCPHACH